MSNWIQVTKLPHNFTENDAIEMFGETTPIKRVGIELDELSSRSTALIEFVNTRSARLAAIKKDNTTYGNATIRVRVVWCRTETLTTVKVSNIPLSLTENELSDYFSPYGEIVDIYIDNTPLNCFEVQQTDRRTGPIKNGTVAWISFARVDHALRACHEMHRSIINGANDDSGLCVRVVNPDSRNLKWKRNIFEYVCCPLPSKHTKIVNCSRQKSLQTSLESPSLLNEASSSLRCDHKVHPVATDENSMRETYYSHTNVSASLQMRTASQYHQQQQQQQQHCTPSTNSSTRSRMPPTCSVNANGGVKDGTMNAPSLPSGASSAIPNSIVTVPFSPNVATTSTHTFVNGFACQTHAMSSNASTLSDMMPSSAPNTHKCSINGDAFSSIADTNSFAIPHLSSSSSSSSSPSIPLSQGLSSNHFANGNPRIPTSQPTYSNLVMNPLPSYQLPVFPAPQLVGQCPSIGETLPTRPQMPSSIGSMNNNLSDCNYVVWSKPTVHALSNNSAHGATSISTSSFITPISTIFTTPTCHESPIHSPTCSSVTSSGNKTVTADSTNANTFQKTSSIESISSANLSSNKSISPIWTAKQREIGDALYHELKLEYPQRVGKLTGMLLALPKDELNRLIKDKLKLKARVHQFLLLLDTE